MSHLSEYMEDLETVCKGCGYARYHDVNNDGMWRDYFWWHNDLCYQRANMSDKAWTLMHTLPRV